MTGKIILELTLDELKTIDKYVELNDETESVFDKIKDAYPQPTMTLQQEGEYAIVSYNDTTYYRFMNETTFAWYIKKGVSVTHPVPTLVMVTDGETERLLDGLYYNHIEVKKEKEPEDNEWKSVALRFGEELVSILPCGYYEFTPDEWYDWVVNTYEKLCDDTVKLLNKEKLKKAQKRGERVHNEMEELVRESVKWCEDHPNENPLDYLTPKSPEQTEQSLKEAFVEAQKTEKWKEIQKLIDEEDNDKNFKNSLDLIKEWGENNKPPTLKELLWEWWEDIFTVDSDLDADASIDVLVDRIEEFLPKEHDTNDYQWNKCLKMIKSKLR